MTGFSDEGSARQAPRRLALLERAQARRSTVAIPLAGVAVAGVVAYSVLKRPGDVSNPDAEFVEEDQATKPRRSRPSTGPSTATTTRAPATCRRRSSSRRSAVGVELQRRQAARVLADRRQDSLYFKDKDALMYALDAEDRQGRVEERVGDLAASSPGLRRRRPLRGHARARRSAVALRAKDGKMLWSATLPEPQRDLAARLRQERRDRQRGRHRLRARPQGRRHPLADARPPATSRAGWRSTTGSPTSATTPARCTRSTPPTAARLADLDLGVELRPRRAGLLDARGRLRPRLPRRDRRPRLQLRADTGELAWSHSTGDWVYSAPAVAATPGSQPTVYIGSNDQNVLRARRGDRRGALAEGRRRRSSSAPPAWSARSSTSA